MRGWLTLIGSQIDVFVAIDASFKLGSTWGKRLFGLRPAKLPPAMSLLVTGCRRCGGIESTKLLIRKA